jgi:hypothetical protein
VRSITKTNINDKKTITDVVWDTWPILEGEVWEYINASEKELDAAAREQRQYEKRVIEEEGPVNGYIRILEEELDTMTERLNQLVEYAQSAEDWKYMVKSEFNLTRKDLVKRLRDYI